MTVELAPEQEIEQLLPWDDEEFRRNPYPNYKLLQAKYPLCHYRGEYIVSKYQDVLKYAKLPCMSVETSWEGAGPWRLSRETILGTDAPHHTQLRRQTNRWFTPKLVQEWVKPTPGIVDEILDGIGDDGVIEAWHNLAAKATHETMCRVLGVPGDGARAVFDGMFDAMQMLSVTATDDDVALAERAFAHIGGRVDGFLADKRANPGHGPIEALIAAGDAGEMTAAEVRSTVMMFYMLGHMDVGYLVASGLELFARRPDIFDAYRAEPENRQAIINEMARIDPPELSLVRHPTEDVEIRGVKIPAGSAIRFMIGAAGRDADVFENPDEFDHRRPPEASRHLAFGLGIHSCAGQAIARAETEIIFTCLTDRYRRIELVQEPETGHNDFVRFYRSLWLRFV